MEKNIPKLEKIAKMKCKRCLQQRIQTKSGICLICKPSFTHGTEVIETKGNKRVRGKIIKAKSGVKDNIWMSG